MSNSFKFSCVRLSTWNRIRDLQVDRRLQTLSGFAALLGAHDRHQSHLISLTQLMRAIIINHAQGL